MDAHHAAVAGLAEDVGRALIRYAGRLRSPAAVDSAGTDEAAASPAAASPPATSSSVAYLAEGPVAPPQVDVRLRRLGVSQRRVLEAVRAAGEAGTTANQVAAVTGLKSTNTPRMLKALSERGLVASWGSNPIVWYAEPRSSA